MKCQECGKANLNFLIKKHLSCKKCGTEHYVTNLSAIYWGLIIFLGLPLKAASLGGNVQSLALGLLIILPFFILVFDVCAQYKRVDTSE
ncbi:MAG: hypothetical protein ACRBCK_06605 [Alphaproteobacteria bacterium]